MEIKITYKVGKMEFSAVAKTIAEAYEYVKAIIESNKLVFTNLENALSEYMRILASFVDGKTLSYSNHIFAIEKI